MIKYTLEEFNTKKFYELLLLTCDACKVDYYKTKAKCYCNMLRDRVLCLDRKTYCSKKCQSAAASIPSKTARCECCNKETTNPKYCSRSCAIKISNRTTPRRKSKPLTKCIKCTNIVANRYTDYCEECRKRGVNRCRASMKPISERTIAEAIAAQTHSRGANRYNAIRSNAQIIYKAETRNAKCENCSFDQHVEVCHIKAVSEFSLDTLVSTVNSRNNIAFLCPNCHWLLDHSKLDINLLPRLTLLDLNQRPSDYAIPLQFSLPL